MGGLAVAVWKHPRSTRDVDLLVDLSDQDLPALIDALRKSGMRPKRQPPVLQIGAQKIIQFLYEAPGTFLDIQIDLLVGEMPYQRVALSRSQSVLIPGCNAEIRVLSCEDLILHKLLAGRIVDRADAAALLRANRANLNLGYLESWVSQLNLRDEFAAVWKEGLPGEKLSLHG
jgi:hypothetical protein